MIHYPATSISILSTRKLQEELVSSEGSHGFCQSMPCAPCITPTVLDTDNLHFSEEFLEIPARADMDICADALEFSARYHADFPQDTARKNLDRNSARICAENGESVRTYVKSLVKLSQFCYSFKDIRKYRKVAKASRFHTYLMQMRCGAPPLKCKAAVSSVCRIMLRALSSVGIEMHLLLLCVRNLDGPH